MTTHQTSLYRIEGPRYLQNCIQSRMQRGLPLPFKVVWIEYELYDVYGVVFLVVCLCMAMCFCVCVSMCMFDHLCYIHNLYMYICMYVCRCT
ncbi:hypothetical protein EON63_23765 [archaeon]|nr:MAG: hypothetical protein EON63_23765 [archaeon]